MRGMRLIASRPSPKIYVILRVYNLTSDQIGMRILLDPGTLEAQGKLILDAEQYTVFQPSSVQV